MPPENTPWYRSSAATLTAGLVGLAVIAGLVIAVVRMSGQWSVPGPDIGVPAGTHLPEPPHVRATTPTSSTSYTTVRLSTTDIGLPGEAPSSTTSSSTTPSGAEPPPAGTTSPPAVAPTFPGSFPTRVTNPPGSTRDGPRINVTRTPGQGP